MSWVSSEGIAPTAGRSGSIYSITRLAALMAIILAFIGLDVTTRYSCQAWVTLGFFSGFLSIAAASLLIVIRVIAIWSRNKVVVAIAAGVWAINVSVMIRGKSFSLLLWEFLISMILLLHLQVRSAWDPSQGGCFVFNIDSTKPTTIVILITDIVLLLIMLVGLLRLRRQSGGAFGIASILWKQGLIWLLLATIVEVPPNVFIILNLNEPLDMIFLHSSVIAMSIAATRMYRSLADSVSGSTEVLPFVSSLAFTTVRVDDSMAHPTAFRKTNAES
ncbi:hypothetical protein BJV74DRAFT_886472 [Russula compacta]|nr:hypothetical protein BJV74DRAFT_886472 [Russula compacta]